MEYDIELEELDCTKELDEKPVIVAGPCSAESEKQVMETADKLKEMGVSIYRAGVWKPRTRPGSFEGMGPKALPWLRKVKRELGMKIAIEVAQPAHIFEALKYDIDIFWIGARTTVNPFFVQDLADAMKGLDNPVFVKNPVNPDLNLWIGAFERLSRAGIKKLAAIHRGFSYFGLTKFRNVPQWEIPIELHRRMPKLPILTDPSHICGRRDLLKEVSQEAMDLNFTGLFIESHINPDVALSDKNQQLKPDDLKKMLKELVIRKEEILDKNLLSKLQRYRKQIDMLDDELMDVLEQRMRIAEKIGEYKKENDITIFQTTRWNEIVGKRLIQAVEKRLSEEFVDKVFRAIHQESIKKQNKIMNE
ncbi:MAG: bifunctional 3-deoxy-7-phosphoheptulonate synthase/chorismate mutase type II [Bacteroidales bacterium]|nr:bifunctional 3-deoxy-7-phosphoheptulonate synthase/chorismate mutase type II [Bacteroidales bacterium]